MPHDNGSMRVIKYGIVGRVGYFVRPENNYVLFKHCAGGPDCSFNDFEQTVRPLLIAHGVKEIRVI